jgi:hypothetical protein
MFVTQLHGPAVSFDDGTGFHVYGWHYFPESYWTGAARWNGAQWIDLGASTTGGIACFAAFDTGGGLELYIGGDFELIAGGPWALHIARWDGSAWHALDGARPPIPREMCAYDDGSGPALYIGGNADIGPEYTPLYKYDGVRLSPVLGVPTSGLNQINKMAVFDDGSGPALYVAGVLPGVIWRFDGHQWTRPGGGVDSMIYSFAAMNDGRGDSLFMVGQYLWNVGGGWTPNIAAWVGCHGQCYPDANNDQRLNVDDFMSFLARWAALDPYTDCTQDRVLNAQDFVCFTQRFAAGCGN